MNQIEVLQNKLSNKLGHSMDIEVQTNVCGGGGDEEMVSEFKSYEM